jgi:alkyldihydroxyacetonephosphate synthase
LGKCIQRAAIDLVAELSSLLGDPAKIDVSQAAIEARAYDWWPLAGKWRQRGLLPCAPDVVVYPESSADVSAVLSWANEQHIAVTAWGLGSSVVGQPLTEYGGISLDLSRMSRVLHIDERNLVVSVEAGINGGVLEGHLNALGYTLNHSPQSLHRSSVGGWLATRATGQFSSRYGGIEDLCFALTWALADGSEVSSVRVPRMAVGPDLKHMVIGSEGCLGVVTQATLKIFPLAESRHYETIAFPTVEAGVDALRVIMAKGLRPFLLRLYDTAEARHAMKDSAYAAPVMFVGAEGVEMVAVAELKAVIDICTGFGGLPSGPSGAEAWMARRFDFSTIENVVSRPTGVAETIEVSNDWSRIMDTYAVMTARLQPFAAEVLGHFSHAYTTGVSLYVILLGEAESAEAAQERLEKIWEVAMTAALETGASISHHHGAGLARNPYVQRALGTGAPLLRRLKSAVDPHNILNPGKLGLPRP